MTALQHLAAGNHYGVHLPEPDDFDLWRERARALVEGDVPPDRVVWSEPGGAGDLFALDGPANAALRLPVPPRDRPPVRASRRHRTLRLEDVARLTQSIAKVRPFICTLDWRPVMLTDRADLRALLAPKQEQLELFAA